MYLRTIGLSSLLLLSISRVVSISMYTRLRFQQNLIVHVSPGTISLSSLLLLSISRVVSLSMYTRLRFQQKLSVHVSLDDWFEFSAISVSLSRVVSLSTYTRSSTTTTWLFCSPTDYSNERNHGLD